MQITSTGNKRVLANLCSKENLIRCSVSESPKLYSPSNPRGAATKLRESTSAKPLVLEFKSTLLFYDFQYPCSYKLKLEASAIVGFLRALVPITI